MQSLDRNEINVRLPCLSGQLATYRNEMRYLTIDDPTKVHAIEMPGFGRKSWRWRVHVPDDYRYQLRLAFDDIPDSGLPNSPPDRIRFYLPAGESILSASIVNEGGKWGVNLRAETDGRQHFDFVADSWGRNTAWLAKNGGCSQMTTGSSSTKVGKPDEPFIFLSYRDGLTPAPGVVATNPLPTDGVMLWLQPLPPNDG